MSTDDVDGDEALDIVRRELTRPADEVMAALTILAYVVKGVTGRYSLTPDDWDSLLRPGLSIVLRDEPTRLVLSRLILGRGREFVYDDKVGNLDVVEIGAPGVPPDVTHLVASLLGTERGRLQKG